MDVSLNEMTAVVAGSGSCRVQSERADKRISKEEKSIYQVSILRKSIGGQKKCFLYYFKFKEIYIWYLHQGKVLRLSETWLYSKDHFLPFDFVESIFRV